MNKLFFFLILFNASAFAQSYTDVRGKFNYIDSLKFSKYKNSPAKDSALTTDSSGRLMLKYISPLASAKDITGELITASASALITLANTPIINTLRLIKNGIRLPPFKYSLSGAIVTLTDERVSTDFFQADYKF